MEIHMEYFGLIFVAFGSVIFEFCLNTCDWKNLNKTFKKPTFNVRTYGWAVKRVDE